MPPSSPERCPPPPLEHTHLFQRIDKGRDAHQNRVLVSGLPVKEGRSLWADRGRGWHHWGRGQFWDGYPTAHPLAQGPQNGHVQGKFAWAGPSRSTKRTGGGGAAPQNKKKHAPRAEREPWKRCGLLMAPKECFLQTAIVGGGSDHSHSPGFPSSAACPPFLVCIGLGRVNNFDSFLQKKSHGAIPYFFAGDARFRQRGF